MVANSTNAAADKNLPARIGRFLPTSCLGKGARGIVYQAHDPDLDREVAIKTLKRLNKNDSLLRNEARNVSKLQHQGIVPLYEFGHHHDTPYLVYRLAEGNSLRKLFDTGESFTEIRACRIFIGLLNAMDYAHNRGILHRDLNPNNILINSEDIPQILDFGVSSVIGTIKTTSEIVGTANYMAPETLSNDHVGQYSDLFSLAVIFHEMLTGKQLFSANKQLAVIYKIINEPVLPPSATNRQINSDLDAIVMKGLQRKPTERYASAAQMKKALETYLHVDEDQPPTAPNNPTNQGAMEFLMRKISRQPDFPAISQHITEITQKTADINQNHTGDLAQVILKDYALTSKLLRLVNAACYSQYGGEITTVSRAVVILGYEQVRMAALSIMLFEHLSNASQASALKDSACSSFLSGVISRQLAKDLDDVDVEEVFISSMFHHLGKHLSIYYFPDEYVEIESLINNRGKSEKSATHEVLGVTYTELGIAIGQEWKLPTTIINSMRTNSSGSVKANRSKHDRMAQISAMSNEISGILGNGDKLESQEAMDKLCERYKSTLKISAHKIDNLMKDSIKEVTDYADILQFDVRSSTFFKKVVKVYAAEEPEEPESDTEQTAITFDSASQTTGSFDTSSPANAPAQTLPGETSLQDHTLLFINGISEITNSLLGDYEINEIVTMVLETIYRGMALTRVMFCIRDNRNQAIVARFGLGRDIDQIIPDFRCKLDKTGDDLFNTSIVKHMDYVVLDVNSEEYKTRIPNWCRQLTKPHSMMLLPVIVNKTCIGLIYADNDKENPRISSDTLRFFGTLRNQVALAIQQKHNHR